jgi:Ca2+-binding EF-hand superfamily protein
MIVVSFIFLNLFIAIILESFNSSQTEEGLQVGQRTIDKFNDIWVKFDERGKGFINVKKFPALLEKILEEEFDQLYDVNNEFKSGEIDQDEFQNQIFMFNLHKDEDLLDIASWK